MTYSNYFADARDFNIGVASHGVHEIPAHRFLLKSAHKPSIHDIELVSATQKMNDHTSYDITLSVTIKSSSGDDAEKDKYTWEIDTYVSVYRESFNEQAEGREFGKFVRLPYHRKSYDGSWLSSYCIAIVSYKIRPYG